MKHIFSIRCALTLAFMVCLLAGCSSHKALLFAEREWHVSDYYGHIIDKDTTYRMTFGNRLVPDPLPIISSADSLSRYPGMDRFISDIFHTCGLDGAEILFYVPHMQTMFVRLTDSFPPLRPSSISSPMEEDNPYTMWVRTDDVEDWTRKPTEMYTYTYYDKGKKRLLVVDHYDYGHTPIAQITVFQSKNRFTKKMSVQDNLRRAYSEFNDISRFMDNVEYWSHGVEARRANAFANYKIGQDPKIRRDCQGLAPTMASLLPPN